MRTIELTGDIQQDKPLGYLVFTGGEYEYMIFTEEQDAWDCASEEENDSCVYPLFAGKPLPWK